ncbi:MAG: VWA domain-containing protein [Fimbriiglobus sp.]
MELLKAIWLALPLVLLGVVCFALAARTRFGLIGGVGFVSFALGGVLLQGSVSVSETSVRWATLVAGAALGLWLFSLVVMFIFRVWSYAWGLFLWSLLLVGAGAWGLRPASLGVLEALGSVRGLQFVRPEWLVLLIFVPVIYVISRRSLSGMGATRKWAAISFRCLGVAALALALAEPRLRRPTENATVLFVVDRSFSIPQELDPTKLETETVDRRWERVKGFMEQAVQKRPASHKEDQVGLVLFGKRPRLALPPALVDRMPIDERQAGPVDGNYTDIGAAIKLALASFPQGTGKRIVLVSDGNENIGTAEEQANVAKNNGVQIDTIALAPGYRNENEILIQAIESPQSVAQGQRLPVRVLVRNASPDKVVDGRLDVVKVSATETLPVEIEDSPQILEPGRPAKVRLMPGLNVFRFRDRVDPSGDSSFTFRATFAPTESRPVAGGIASTGLPGDRIENNRVETAVVSRGQRRVLLLDESEPGSNRSTHEHLLSTLRFELSKKENKAQVKLRVDRLPADKLPTDKGELGVFLTNYDAVILANVPFERFTNEQAEMLRSQVYDQGCGLVMIGGPDSFGAGGYQGTPIEAALPVDCEIKALKAAGKGGLILIMHASEMADGNKWQKDIGKLAIQRLGPADMIGVVQYGWGGGSGVTWHIPFQQVGEVDSTTRNNILAKLDSMVPGDMPDFDPFLVAAYDTLSDPKYNLATKHCILISDGDPNYSGPGQAAVKKMSDGGITCTTVGVATHGGAEKSKLKVIAEGTKDGDGKKGNFYDVTNPNQLPAIYIKESRRVSQSFIYKEPFVPKITASGGSSEVLPQGLPNALPRLKGFVRTTMKQNILAGMSLEGPSPYPDQQFPLLASWRYGLGKAVAFTSDARTQPGAEKQYWDEEWVGSELYRKFWEQLINWVMREPERGKLTMTTEYRDGRVRVVADVRDEKDRPVVGVTLKGAVTSPKNLAPGEKAPVLEFKPKGGGLYEAEFPAEEAGSYFVNVNALEAEKDAKGGLVMNADGTAKLKSMDAGRAGVTVPYSPEFADLESNTPLMKRIAEITGGQFHTEAPEDLAKMLAEGALFRDPPETTRAILPFWFWLVFAAAVLLFFDVAMRRISLETKEVNAFAARVWKFLRQSASYTEADDTLDRLSKVKKNTSATLDTRKAKRFEPDANMSIDPAPAGADDYAAETDARGPSLAAPPKGDRPDAPPPEDPGDTLAKLRKARDRAKHRKDDTP